MDICVIRRYIDVLRCRTLHNTGLCDADFGPPSIYAQGVAAKSAVRKVIARYEVSSCACFTVVDLVASQILRVFTKVDFVPYVMSVY